MNWNPSSSILAAVLPLIISAGEWYGPPAAVFTDIGKVELLADGRILFVNEDGATSRTLRSIKADCLAIISSEQRGYVALVHRRRDGRMPISIHRSTGDLVSRFDLETRWAIGAVSDLGPTISIYERGHALPTGVVRFADSRGKILYQHPPSNHYSMKWGFSDDGKPYVWIPRNSGGTRQPFVRILKHNGELLSELRLATGTGIHDVSVGKSNSYLALTTSKKRNDFPDAVQVFRMNGTDLQMTYKVDLPSHSKGVVQGPASLGSHCKRGLFRLGAHEVYLCNFEQKSMKEFSFPVVAGESVIKIAAARFLDNKRLVIVGIGESSEKQIDSYCCLGVYDLSGKLLQSRVYRGKGFLNISFIKEGRIGLSKDHDGIVDIWRP
ncbi:MAG: hypothetical protein QF473_08095 [Planctomycetota bacterium]|jgi:hypothetical protein|nr:hypothetical protein [Planctomycetota bacterium]